MDKRVGLGIAAFGLLWAATGCGESRYFLWNSRPAAPAVSGKLAIEVHDKREPNKGGSDPRAVGLGTGAFGIPETIRLSTPTEVSEAMHEYVGQAALASGLAVAAPGDTTPTGKAIIEVQTLWCSGYAFVFKADVTLSVMVVDPATNMVRMAAVPFHTDDGDSDCRGAYKKALSKGFEAAVALMSQMKPAAMGAGAAPPPQAPPPPAQ